MDFLRVWSSFLDDFSGLPRAPFLTPQIGTSFSTTKNVNLYSGEASKKVSFRESAKTFVPPRPPPLKFKKSRVTDKIQKITFFGQNHQILFVFKGHFCCFLGLSEGPNFETKNRQFLIGGRVQNGGCRS